MGDAVTDMELSASRKYSSRKKRKRQSTRSTSKQARATVPKATRLSKPEVFAVRRGDANSLCKGPSNHAAPVHSAGLDARFEDAFSDISHFIPVALPSNQQSRLDASNHTVVVLPGVQAANAAERAVGEVSVSVCTPQHPPVTVRVDPQRSPSSRTAKFLVDKAIKVLEDVWKEENIPTVFASMMAVSSPRDDAIKTIANDCDETAPAEIIRLGGLIPIETFVEEILARSRTTGAVLQVALNYIDVLRPRLASLAQSEPCKELNLPSKILDKDTLVNVLPSPLLCPRRVFLATVILASKFLEDICASNREWAKLAGLPAWEVGRCERAVGEALDWRLWVLSSSDVASRLENVHSPDQR